MDKILLSDDELIHLNQLGLIPGSNETENEFFQRTQACLQLMSKISNNSSLLPFQAETDPLNNALQEAFALTQSLYDIRPTWLLLFFTNYRLAPWHGGAAWIFQLKDPGPRMAFMQLRKAFRTKEKYLGMYQRQELIAHEIAHVGRMMFDEERFEEILAYRTSVSPLRRWLGPIVESGKESLFFLGSLFILLALDVGFLISGNEESYFWGFGLKLLPIALLTWGFLRLRRKHKTFDACLRNLEETLVKEKASHVIYRLKDQEILLFSELSPSKILEYVNEQQKSSLRWHTIYLAYFS